MSENQRQEKIEEIINLALSTKELSKVAVGYLIAACSAEIDAYERIGVDLISPKLDQLIQVEPFKSALETVLPNGYTVAQAIKGSLSE